MIGVHLSHYSSSQHMKHLAERKPEQGEGEETDKNGIRDVSIGRRKREVREIILKIATITINAD